MALVDNREIVTLIIALVGAVLGFVNFFRDIRRSRRQERVRLKVNPKLGAMHPHGIVSTRKKMPENPEAFLVVEVVNHSYFPVFLDGLYLQHANGRRQEKVVIQPSVYPKQEWPVKLEQRESVTLCKEHLTVTELVKVGTRGVYIKTSTGQRFNGSAPVFGVLHSRYKELRKRNAQR